MEIDKSQITSEVNSVNCKSCWLNNFSINSSLKDTVCKIHNSKDIITYNKGEYLVEKGDLLFGVFCIESGIVKVSKRGNKNKEFILWIAGKGDIVGLNSFINNEPFSFSASATDEVRVCFIPASELRILLEKEPVIFVQLMKSLCEKLDFIEQRIISISRKSIREQCAEILISIARKKGKENRKSIYVDYSISDLASIIGTSRNYLYKIILEFTKKKILSFHNRKWVINNMEALSLIAMGNDKYSKQ